MARSVRIEYGGAVYHVLCRGDRREAIFRDEKDRWIFLDTLAQMCERTGHLVHSYVLMPNHYHLLVETPEPNLVAGMKWFQGTYTQRFNRRHDVQGHLFQGRYKALPVDGADPEYFRKVSDYIHLNPIRAGLLGAARADLRAYRWCSYARFVGAPDLPAWLVRARVFASLDLPDEGGASRRRYAAYMRVRAGEARAGDPACEADWQAMRRGWYVGGESFREQLLVQADKRARGRRRGSYRPEGLALHDEREAIRRVEQATAALGVDLPDLWARRQTDPVKQAVAWWVKSATVMSDEWLGRKLEMGCRTNIHRAVAAFRAPRDDVRRRYKRKLQLCAD